MRSAQLRQAREESRRRKDIASAAERRLDDHGSDPTFRLREKPPHLIESLRCIASAFGGIGCTNDVGVELRAERLAKQRAIGDREGSVRDAVVRPREGQPAGPAGVEGRRLEGYLHSFGARGTENDSRSGRPQRGEALDQLDPNLGRMHIPHRVHQRLAL